METTNHEYYVSLEVAKLLKEAGFDWKCTRYYQNDDKTLYGPLVEQYKLVETNFNVAPVYMDQYSAPILDAAQRWLREVKGIEVYAHVFYDSRDMLDELVVYVYEVNHITKHIEDYILSYDVYHTYEEAQEAGIKKVLEMILEKEEKS